MTLAMKLEDFGAPPAPEPTPDAETDAAIQAGYERGYRSGWDDATEAARAEQAQISAELARNLRDLGLTYFEARDAVLQSLHGFLAQWLGTLFPAALPAATRATLLSELERIAAEGLTDTVEIVVTPDEEATVAALLSGDGPLAHRVLAEPALSAGQAYLRFADSEVEIDLTPIVETLRGIATDAPPQETDADER